MYEFSSIQPICSISTKKVWISSSNHMQHFNQKCLNFHHPTICSISTKNVWIFIKPTICSISTKNVWIFIIQPYAKFQPEMYEFSSIQPYAAFQPKWYEFHHPTIYSISTKNAWIFIIQPYAAFQLKTYEFHLSIHANFEQKCHHELFHHEFTKSMYVYFTMDVLWSPTWLPIPPKLVPE